MWSWLWRRKSGDPPSPTPVLPATVSPSHGERADTEDSETASHLALVGWLIDAPALPDAPLRAVERAALDSIDTLLADAGSVSHLLPRAPSVIPRLLGALRQRDLSVRAIVDRVSKDLPLVAQVMNMARSAAHAGQGEVRDLAHAIAIIGEHGLQLAISRVLLRPMLQAGGGALSELAAQRLWEHAELTSRLCSAKAAAAGLDPFDGCMAGLMHGAGWTAAFRQLDRGTAPPRPWTGAFVEQLVARREPLFGQVVGPWKVSPAVSALAAEAASPGFGDSPSILARVLLESDREATAERLRAPPAEVDFELEPAHPGMAH